jgi:hypothetical protein
MTCSVAFFDGRVHTCCLAAPQPSKTCRGSRLGAGAGKHTGGGSHGDGLAGVLAAPNAHRIRCSPLRQLGCVHLTSPALHARVCGGRARS